MKVINPKDEGAINSIRNKDGSQTFRTILDKSLGSGKTSHRDMSLLFLDLSKAFDKVPHDLLWEKRTRMGFHPRSISVLKYLYKRTHLCKSNGQWMGLREVFIRSGVKQGCPLSPLVWALFISDIGLLMEQSPGGVLIWGQKISALLFVDDNRIINQAMSIPV